MKTIKVKDYEALSRQGCIELINTIKNNKQAKIVLATGYSPELMYQYFCEEVKKQNLDLSEVTFIELDEWHNLEKENKATCYHFIKTNLLDKLENYKEFIYFDSMNQNVEEELDKYNKYINNNDIDLMILGLGMNGHLGLNEPNDILNYNAHYTLLDEKTKTHKMAVGNTIKGGLSIGFNGIFKSKKVLMLITGERKEDAYRRFISKEITTEIPSSLLWLHQNCITYIDSKYFN